MTSRTQPPLLTKTWAHGRSPNDAFIIALGALVITLTATLTFRRVTTPWSTLPDYDYWELISGLVTPNGLDLALANLFRHGNDHIVVIPKLIYAGNYLITSGSNTGLIVYSIAVGAACAALLIFLARNLLHDTPWRLAACAVLFPLVMFSAKLGEVYFRGMGGTIWLTANLFVILSAAALAKAIANGRPVWLFASLLAGLLGMLSNTTAVYSLIVLIGFCLALSFVPRFRGPMPTAAPVTVATLIVIVLGLVITYRVRSLCI